VWNPATACDQAPFGLSTFDHAVPSQCGMSVRSVSPCRMPTAQALFEDVVLTPRSKLRCTPEFGLLTFVQAVPFQRRTS
jgi:hypothetical protein